MAGWQPRNFTDPDLALMLLQWIVSPKDFSRSVEIFHDAIVVAQYGEPEDYEGAHVTRVEGPLPEATREIAARIRGVWNWKEDS